MTDNSPNPTNGNTNGTNDIQPALKRIVPLLRELAESVNQNIYMGMDGTGEMSAGLYRTLHAKVARLLPDDEFVTSALVLKYPKTIEDDDLLGVVNLAIRQLLVYLETEFGIVDTKPGKSKEKRKLRRIIEDDDDFDDGDEDTR